MDPAGPRFCAALAILDDETRGIATASPAKGEGADWGENIPASGAIGAANLWLANVFSNCRVASDRVSPKADICCWVGFQKDEDA